MKKYLLYAEINVGEDKKCYGFASDNFYEVLGKTVVLYRGGYSVELFIEQENERIGIYKHEQGKKEEGILRLED